MKIGSKIALFYTLISVLTTVIIIAVFYIFSTQYINKLYASYLREKAYLTAQKHWEKDEVDEQSYQIIQRKYDELLPEAHEILLNMDSLSEVRDTLNKYLTQHQQTLLLAGQDSIPFSFKYKDQLGAALYYPDNEGNFIVLVMSRNAYGTEIKEHLLLLSIFLVLASSILIFFIGKIYSGRILVPLQHILKELKRIRANSLNRRLKTTGNNDELEDMIKTLNNTNISYIHMDVMDGQFVPQRTLSYPELQELSGISTKKLDIHLMMDSPEEYIDNIKDLDNIENITIHLEIDKDIKEILSKIKSLGFKRGLSIKPNTDINKLVPYLDDIDLILVMTVEPGLGGQQFLESSTKRLKEIKELIGTRDILLEVDGGINNNTINLVKDANIAVVGSYITKSTDPVSQINSLLV